MGNLKVIEDNKGKTVLHNNHSKKYSTGLYNGHYKHSHQKYKIKIIVESCITQAS